jgi:hypothetical protein
VRSGFVNLDTGAGAIAIGGDLIGGGDKLAGSIRSFADVASIRIGGSMVSGTGPMAGSIMLGESISDLGRLGSLTVKGNLFGTAANPVNIVVPGNRTPVNDAEALAIKTISIGGDVRFARILAGYTVDGFGAPVPNHADAQIGTVTVGGDWIASSLAAGVRPNDGVGTDIYLGNADDTVIPGGSPTIVSKIGSILIKGIVLGTPDVPGDHFGFVAEQIGSFKSLGFTAALTAATDAPLELALTTGDVTIREL